MHRTTILGIGASALLALAGAANADTIQFSNPSGPANPTLADQASNPTAYTTDIVAWSLTWASKGLTVTGGYDNDNDGKIEADNNGPASGGTNEFKKVIQDLSPTEGGLGVDYGADEVDYKEALILTWDEAVLLSSITLRNKDHGTSFPDNTFRVRVDGGSFQLFDLAASVALNLSGTTFEFWHSTSSHDSKDFYLASVTYSEKERSVPTVPEPATMALLGAGLVGAAWKRRRLAR